MLILLALLIFIASIIGAAAILFKKLYRLDTYKDALLTEVRKSLNREVRYDQGRFSLAHGPSFTFSQVVIEEKGESQATPFVKAERMDFRLSVLPLLAKRIVVKDIVFEKPLVRIYRNRDGTFNISDLLERKKQRTIQVKELHLRGASIIITDRFVNSQGITHRIEEMDLSISNLKRGGKTKYALSAVIVDRVVRSEINIKGQARLSAEDQPFFESVFDARVMGKNLHADHYWDYYSRYVPFKKILGYLDVESSFKGKLKEFETKGKIEIKGLRFNYPSVFHAVLAPKNIQLKYSMALSPRDVKVKTIDIDVDGFHARGSCDILDIPSRDPRIVAHAVTSKFKLESYFHYIPFGIIPQATSEFIEKNIKAGTCRLDDGRLDGRVSRIARMWEKDNYRVLSIHGTVIEGGLLRLNDQIPAFNSIEGNLILEGKNFTLRNMSGKFGTSPFTMNGEIKDYCLKTPQSYPFSMEMIPNRAEVAWLLGKSAGSKLKYSGTSTFRLSGRGLTSDYKLSGDWNLKNAAYSHGQIINKPAGKDNRIAFSGSINQAGFGVTAFKYDLIPLALALSARYTWGEKEKLYLAVNSNHFQMDDVAKYFPLIEKYRPQGKVQLAVQGNGNTSDPLHLNWDGEISLSGAACVLTENIKPVSNITGVVRIKGDGLETSNISARVGTSLLSGKGSLTHFRNPSFNADFVCPKLELSDLGLRSPSPEKKLTGIKGSLSWHEGNLIIKALSGRIDNSTVDLKGRVTDLNRPTADIQVTSSYLEIEDVLTLAGIRKVEQEKESGHLLNLKATLIAEKGKWQDLPFRNLRGEMTYDKQVLKMQSLAFDSLEGKVTTSGQIDFSDTKPLSRVEFSIEKIAAEELINILGWKNALLTGSLSARGQLTVRADTVLDLKKTASGEVSINMEKGMMRQFPTLSKIFSILNVSQLLKFQLPDMVSGGMPYNEIKGSFIFRDGYVSTQDLYVKSDAINIAAVGKIEMVREEIDATFGIQPLQTVDKIVNRIPIVGWIITGKEGTFVTTYFESKGKLADPNVTAIPFQSMATGVFNIFKRVFQLPVKIFTNTGEVLIGN